MAQALPRNCPRCGAPTVEGMRFCANCGLSAEAMLTRVGTSQYPQPPRPLQPAVQQTRPTGTQAQPSPPVFAREDQQEARRTSRPPETKRSLVTEILVLQMVAVL